VGIGDLAPVSVGLRGGVRRFRASPDAIHRDLVMTFEPGVLDEPG
jgi:hypothetical protein